MFSYLQCEVKWRVSVEWQNVVLSRIRYRRRIKKQRKVGYTFVYTDEIYMHTSHVAWKCWQESSKGITLLFFKR